MKQDEIPVTLAFNIIHSANAGTGWTVTMMHTYIHYSRVFRFLLAIHLLSFGFVSLDDRLYDSSSLVLAISISSYRSQRIYCRENIGSKQQLGKSIYVTPPSADSVSRCYFVAVKRKAALPSNSVTQEAGLTSGGGKLGTKSVLLGQRLPNWRRRLITRVPDSEFDITNRDTVRISVIPSTSFIHTKSVTGKAPRRTCINGEATRTCQYG